MTSEDEFWESGGRYREADHPVVDIFSRQRIRHLARRGALANAASLLDVGAGSGSSSRNYPKSIRVVGCDFADGMLRDNPLPDRVRCAADTLPFEAASFDIVTCWELLHHLEDPVAAIRDMWRVARRRVILFEPNRIHPGHIVLGLTRQEERRSLRFSPSHLRHLVAQATGRRGRLHERCGLLFPNITPLPLARLMDKLPFRVPLAGISQLLVVEKE